MITKRQRCFTVDELLAKLRIEVEREDTQTKYAKIIGISQPMLSQILSGERKPSEEVLRRLEMVAVEHYEESK